jgi:hypothetical protein
MNEQEFVLTDNQLAMFDILLFYLANSSIACGVAMSRLPDPMQTAGARFDVLKESIESARVLLEKVIQISLISL